MKLVPLPQELSVYQVSDFSQVDFTQQPLFIGRTDEENSIVSATANVPSETIKREDGWRAFKIEGVLDFSLVGILAKLPQSWQRLISVFLLSQPLIPIIF